MALVFKIKHNGTLRRWVVSQALPENNSAFPISVSELVEKVRELFHFAANKVLLITYVDKEGDVVTLADDQDLLDACVVQGLNPLRLDVQIVENKHNANANSAANTNPPATSHSGNTSADFAPIEYPHVTSPLPSPGSNSERSSKPPFPQVTADAIKQFLTKYTQAIDPNLQPAVLLKNIHQALKDFVKTIVHEGQKLAPRVTPPARTPTYTRCASEPPLRYPSMDGTHTIVHVGVRCDNCNSYPIQGVRYKSTKVFNYDLCSSCFDKMGNETDYQKMDKPASFPHHGFYHPSCSKGPRVPMRWGTPFAAGTDGWKSECPFLRTQSGCPANVSKELDSSFVKDMTVFDGSEVIPRMQFKKIVRLKNSGSKPWPQGTQLVHIGGNELSVNLAVDLKLPVAGFPVGLELDICLDMRAPDTAGNYISHWCLIAPNGERFGKSVWVAIQVVRENQESSESSQEQPACEVDDKAGNIQRKIEPACEVDDKAEAVQEASNIQRKIEPVTVPQVYIGLSGNQNKEQEGSSINGHENVYNADKGSSSVNLVDKSPHLSNAVILDEGNADSSDEIDGFSMIEKPVDAGTFKMMHAPVVSSQLSFPEPTNVIDEQYARMSPMEIAVQESNLHSLELMGFINRDLNAVLLEKNKQDLQLTLDDLLLGSGWDNLLKDLHEMGFKDTYTNLRLLIKNEGSIKRVVKELVELEKQKVEE